MATQGSPSTEDDPSLDGTTDPYQFGTDQHSTAGTTVPRPSQPEEFPLSRPTDPILPFVAPALPRRRGSDWLVLTVAMVLGTILMVGCCLAGFALNAGFG